MAESVLPQRVTLPPSSVFTGDAYTYLSQIAGALNAMPSFSYTSYTGGPNSNLTALPGSVCVNIVTSAQTKRLHVKELGSGNTGWVSFATIL